MKNPNDPIWNLTHNLSACSTAPQPIGPPNTPTCRKYLSLYIMVSKILSDVATTDMSSLQPLYSSYQLHYWTDILLIYKIHGPSKLLI